jgi:hypothetical protein
MLVLIVELILILLIILFTGAWLFAFVLAIAAIGLYLYANKLKTELTEGPAMLDPEKMVTALEAVPQRPNFIFTETDPVVRLLPQAAPLLHKLTKTSSTSPDAIKFQNSRLSLLRSRVVATVLKQKIIGGLPSISTKDYRFKAP